MPAVEGPMSLIRSSSGLRGTLVAIAAALLAAAGCAGGVSAPPSPSTLGIAHPSGPDDVVLRLFTGGGFVPPGFIVTEAPSFSLYGDGTLIYRDQASPLPTPVDGVAQGAGFRIAKLSEPQVQALLRDALDTGGLRTAKPQYVLPVADAPTATFTVNADGLNLQVQVNGLGLVQPTAPDAAAINALASLDDRLLAYGSTLANSQAWQPVQYRGYLLDVTDTTSVPIAWPWPDFSPHDWTNVPDEAASLPFPIRLMTRKEVEALGLGPLAGGATGIVVSFGSGTSAAKLYGVSLRPLLPDETAG